MTALQAHIKVRLPNPLPLARFLVNNSYHAYLAECLSVCFFLYIIQVFRAEGYILGRGAGRREAE